MKIYKPITLIAFISMIVLANSCFITHPNEKMIIGKWKPVKVEKFNPPVTDSAAIASLSSSTPKTDSVSLKKGKNIQGKLTPAQMENQLNRMAVTEERTPLQVYSEKKKFVKQYPGKTVTGTWKMKKKGTQIHAKADESGKKQTLNIEQISDTSFVVLEHFPYGDIRITYHKVR
jgi:hypothetical protein